MALKTLTLRKKIDLLRKQLNPLLEKREAYKQREAELEADIDKAEQIDADVEAAIDAFEAERDENDKAIGKLEGEIEGLERDLEAEEQAQNTNPPAAAGNPQTSAEINEQRGRNTMNTRDIIPAMNLRDRVAGIVTRDDVQNYLGEVRTAIKEKRAVTGAGLLIPDVMLELIRVEIAHASRLERFLNVKHISGTAKQNISGTIPEAVWTEMQGAINEITLGFNQITADGHKVGAYVAIPNSILEDSNIALAVEIITGIAGAIAKARDKATLFGDGVHMPLGIVTRLAQQSKPANWGANAPAWTDLHSTHICTLNIDGTSGAAFFQSLLDKLALAKPKTSAEGLFWVMNRKTHLHIMAKALAFNAQAALVANTELMPVIGGTVVEFEDDEIADNEIIGGFGKNYLSIERAGVEYASSDIPLFLQEQTVFKGSGRYDGLPVFGEAFVIVNFANTSPTTSKDFAPDWANTDLNELTVSAAASASNVGKTVLTVSDTLAESSPVLYYKLGTQKVAAGDAIATTGTGAWSELTSGTTEITAAAGKKITVVELNAAAASGGVVVSAGVVASVPKAAG